MANKTEIYRWIKLSGMISLIPFFMIAGPLSCYLLGDFLYKQFGLSQQIRGILIFFGFIAGLVETLRVFRYILKNTK